MSNLAKTYMKNNEEKQTWNILLQPSLYRQFKEQKNNEIPPLTSLITLYKTKIKPDNFLFLRTIKLSKIFFIAQKIIL